MTQNEGFIAASLREITAHLQSVTGEGAYGLLGGDDGYGVDWDNDIFTMRPFYWGDCDCGYEDALEQWAKANPAVHDDHDMYGSCLRNGCEWWVRYDAQANSLQHDMAECSLYLPNFAFKPSGVEVRWYKYIGRSMEVSGDLPRDFAQRCIESVAR